MSEISIIVPTYNRADFVGGAVRSCLDAETELLLQVIVIDDASTDGTREVLAEFGGQIDILPLFTNVGAAQARNIGLARATGQYVKFLDSDDVLEPGALGLELAAAREQHADIVMSDWGTVRLDADFVPMEATRRVHKAPEMPVVIDAVLEGKAVPLGAALYRRAHIRDLRWDIQLRRAQDWHFFCQASLRNARLARRSGIAFWWQHHRGARVSATDSLTYARSHHRILRSIEDQLRSSGALTTARKRQLAQYYYKQLSVLAMWDRAGFEWAVSHISELDPDFRPWREEPKRYMRSAARVVGFRRAILLYIGLKRILRRGAGGSER